MDVDDEYNRFLIWRGIAPGRQCLTCEGSGVRHYPSTAMWMGGLGGAMITTGVCDTCWGSGNSERHWTNLRLLHAEREGIKRMIPDYAYSDPDANEAVFAYIRELYVKK